MNRACFHNRPGSWITEDGAQSINRNRQMRRLPVQKLFGLEFWLLIRIYKTSRMFELILADLAGAFTRNIDCTETAKSVELGASRDQGYDVGEAINIHSSRGP